ncbi:MAG: hypothetical protein OHK0029_27900 [Armatimonadaceae bacterium]
MSFPDAANIGPSEEDILANAEPIKPLPRIAEENPAPENLPPLDKAEAAVSEKPDDGAAQLQLAFVLYRARAYADASRAFERATALLPDDPTPLIYLGYTQLAVGALNSAIETYEKVLKLEEKGVSRDILSEAYLQIGNAQGALGNLDKAREAFSKSIGYNPKQGLASLALGALAAEKGNLDQAKDFWTDAVTDLPKGRHQAQAYASLGKLAEMQKDPKTAATRYRKALTIDEENTWAKQGMERLAGDKKPANAPKPADKQG